MHLFSRHSFVSLRIAYLLGVIAVLVLPKTLRAQTAENLAAVKRVAVDWSQTDRGAAAIRDRVVQKLKASAKLEFVPSAAQADGLLHGSVGSG